MGVCNTSTPSGSGKAADTGLNTSGVEEFADVDVDAAADAVDACKVEDGGAQPG